MATKYPRISVSVTDAQNASLESMSAALGISKSQIISKLISDSLPVMTAVTKAVVRAKSQTTKLASDAVDREFIADSTRLINEAQLMLDGMTEGLKHD